MYEYLKKMDKTNNISSWKSKGLSDEFIKPLDNTFAPESIYCGKKNVCRI